MADDSNNGDDVMFVYMGGDQRVPRNVRYVRVHKSVKIITRMAFRNCTNLVSIEMHDGVEIIEAEAFGDCTSLRRIKLPGVKVIETNAFRYCEALDEVEFGDKLETIEACAFANTALRNVKLPKVRFIGQSAISDCDQLTDVELSEDLEYLVGAAFHDCPRLRRISMPFKNNLLHVFPISDYPNLSQVDLVGDIHKTISLLLLESWVEEMKDEINQINLDLPHISRYEKTRFIHQWMQRVIERITHYKSEHYALLKKAMVLLELALWKNELEKTTKDDDEEEHSVDEKQPAKKAKVIADYGEAASSKELRVKEEIYVDAAKQKARVTCGANIIIPHVLSFLNDADVFPLLNQN